MEPTRQVLRDIDISAEDRKIRVEMSINPSGGCTCPIMEAGKEGFKIKEIRRKTSKSRCESDIVVAGNTGDEVVNAVTEVQDECFCPNFENLGILPRIEEVNDDGVVVSAYFSSRQDIKGVLESLRSESENVRLLRIEGTDKGKKESGSVKIDLGDLSHKQRETLRKAVIKGYYDDPPETSLGDLSDEFGVSKSAISQRLNRAEAKLAIEAFES